MYDPLAVAMGNASLLGLGYLVIRRRLNAIAAVLVTVVLVVNLARRRSGPDDVWWPTARA